MPRTVSKSAAALKQYPRRCSRSTSRDVISLPAMFSRLHDSAADSHVLHASHPLFLPFCRTGLHCKA